MKLPPLIIALCALGAAVFAQKPARSDARAPIEDRPGLPRALRVVDPTSIALAARP